MSTSYTNLCEDYDLPFSTPAHTEHSGLWANHVTVMEAVYFVYLPQPARMGRKIQLQHHYNMYNLLTHSYN